LRHLLGEDLVELELVVNQRDVFVGVVEVVRSRQSDFEDFVDLLDSGDFEGVVGGEDELLLEV